MRQPTCFLCADPAAVLLWEWTADGSSYCCRRLCDHHAHTELEHLVGHPRAFFDGVGGVYMTTLDESTMWWPYERARRQVGTS